MRRWSSARCLSASMPVWAFLVSGLSPLQAMAPSDEVGELRQLVRQQAEAIARLTARVQQLEARIGSAKDADLPPLEIPSGQAAAPKAKASALPDIAVIGNHIGKFLAPRSEEGRNTFRLAEFELSLQHPIYTGASFRAVLAGGEDAGFGLSAEEAYVTASRPFRAPFDAVVGRRRVPFGRTNQLHPHQRPYVDKPAALEAMLGGEGLSGNGAAVNATLPLRPLFANLELGLYRSADEHAEQSPTPQPGLGVLGDLPVARLWLSSPIGAGAEAEAGLNWAFGRTAIGNHVDLIALDAVYRAYPGTFRSFRAQAEAYWHRVNDRVGGAGRHTRAGWFGLLTFAPSKYDEFGLRVDSTRYPWPIEGSDRSLSVFWTNRLTEATALRLQLKSGSRFGDVLLPARRGYSEAYLQLLWGAGSHTHQIQ